MRRTVRTVEEIKTELGKLGDLMQRLAAVGASETTLGHQVEAVAAALYWMVPEHEVKPLSEVYGMGVAATERFAANRKDGAH